MEQLPQEIPVIVNKYVKNSGVNCFEFYQLLKELRLKFPQFSSIFASEKIESELKKMVPKLEVISLNDISDIAESLISCCKTTLIPVYPSKEVIWIKQLEVGVDVVNCLIPGG